MESMVPVCDKRYHIYNRFRHFWAEIKKLWNYPLRFQLKKTAYPSQSCPKHVQDLFIFLPKHRSGPLDGGSASDINNEYNKRYTFSTCSVV